MIDPAPSEHGDVHAAVPVTPSARLKARLEQLEEWRVEPMQISFLQGDDARKFFGGHATVTKAVKEDYFVDFKEGEVEVENSCKPIQGRAERPEEAATDSDKHVSAGWTLISKSKIEVAVKQHKIGDNTDLEKSRRLALREAELLTELDHLNVMYLEGFVDDTAQNTIWLIFPWFGNGNLRDFVASEDWEVPERISLVFDVSRGLEYLHAQDPPIYHGDLKSMNIVVDWDYRALITDFGSARRMTNRREREAGRTKDRRQPELHTEATFCAFTSTVTLTGNNFTIRWAAPEQLLSEGPASLRCDIWALGWIAYEVITNSIPFGNIKKDFIVIQSVLQGKLPDVVGDPRFTIIRNLCSLMTRCWRSEPTERPTASECCQWMIWMPMIIPSPRSSSSSDDLERRSPQLLQELGTLYRNQNDFSKAFKVLTEALDIHTQLGNEMGKAEVLFGIGSIHLRCSKWDLAAQHYQQALHIWSEQGMTGDRAYGLYGLGDAHRFGGALDKAVSHYSEALEIYTEAGHGAGRASVLCALGEVGRWRNELESAVQQYSEALAISTDLGSKEGRANALYGLGNVDRARNQLDQAILRLSEALDIYTELEEMEGKTNASYSLGESHRMRNEFDQALLHYSKDIELSAESGSQKCQASALYSLADVHRARNELDQEMYRLSELLGVFTEPGDKADRAKALNRLGKIHRLRNEFNLALSRHSEALAIYVESGDKGGGASSLIGLGESHRLCQNFDQAIVRFSEALNIYTELGDNSGLANASFGLGESYRLRSEYDPAFLQYSKALEIFTNLGSKRSRAATLHGLASVHCGRNELDIAITQYSEALDILIELGDKAGQAKVIYGISYVHRLRNELDKALLLLSEALDIHTELGSKEDRCVVLDDLAEVHHLLGENCDALRLYSEALSIFNELGDQASRGPILAALAKINQFQGDYDQAVANYTQALQISLEIGDNDLRVDALQGLPEVLRLAHPNAQKITVPVEVAGPLRCSRHGEISGPCVVRMQIRLTDGEGDNDDFCQCVANRAQSGESNAAGIDSATKPTWDVTPPHREPTPEQEATPSTSFEVAQ